MRSQRRVTDLLIAGLLVGGLNLVPELSRAQDVAVPLVHEGRPGVWFTLDEARRLNALDVSSALHAREVRLLETQLSIAVEREIPALRRALDLSERIAGTWRGVVQTANERATEAEERLDAWWREPGLWFALGVITTGVIAGVVVLR